MPSVKFAAGPQSGLSGAMSRWGAILNNPPLPTYTPHTSATATCAALLNRPISSLMPITKYIVKPTPYTGEQTARGVFAESRIERGELVETAHCILVPPKDYGTHFRHAQQYELQKAVSEQC